jgi:peptidoglycan hydrolase-like protein with peptidoglycan-binding domain
MQAWERASGLPTTSTVTSSVVAQLEGDSAAPPPRADRDWRRDDRRADRMSSSETIRQTQHELNRLGYNLTYEGGRLNGETSDAIRNWQARHGLEQTGMPDRQLLAQMRRDTQRIDPNITWRTSSSTTAPVDNSMSQAQLISQTQWELSRHGYSVSSNGGMLDADTTNAIRAYQSANGLTQTGMPSAQLLATLRSDNRMVSQPLPPVQSGYPTSYGTPIPPPQQVQCADFLHQSRPGGSDYSGPPVPGCN